MEKLQKLCGHIHKDLCLAYTRPNNESFLQDSGKKNIFASFGGFKPTASLNSTNEGESVPSKPVFGSLGKALTSGSGIILSAKVDNKSAFSFLGNAKPTSNGPSTTTTTNPEKGAQEKYMANLKHLNRTLSDWVKQSIDENPNCILSNVFNEYDK